MTVRVMKSMIEHNIAGIGFLARGQFGSQMAIEYYSRKLMWTNVYGYKDDERRYIEVRMSASV